MKYIPDFFDPNHFGSHNPNAIPNFIKDFIRMPLVLFKISFVAGTTLLLLYLTTKFESLLMIGLFYVVIAFLVNALLLGYTLIIAVVHHKFCWLIISKLSILLVNIPITMLYISLIHL